MSNPYYPGQNEYNAYAIGVAHALAGLIANNVYYSDNLRRAYDRGYDSVKKG